MIGSGENAQVFFFGFDPQEGGHLQVSFDSFPEHISLSIDARLFIFWWYDGHIVSGNLPFGTFDNFFDLRFVALCGNLLFAISHNLC
jgi:hypothetical protein